MAGDASAHRRLGVGGISGRDSNPRTLPLSLIPGRPRLPPHRTALLRHLDVPGPLLGMAGGPGTAIPRRPAKEIHVTRCCNDVAVHCHDGKMFKDGRPYAYRFAFKPRWPKAVVVRTAVNPAPRFVLNRYPGIVIGFAVRLRGNAALSVLWGRPGRIVEVTAA